MALVNQDQRPTACGVQRGKRRPAGRPPLKRPFLFRVNLSLFLTSYNKAAYSRNIIKTDNLVTTIFLIDFVPIVCRFCADFVPNLCRF
jgi:hypothetical protein